MPTKQTKTNTKPTLTARMGNSYGCPEPQLQVALPPKEHRRAKAAAYRIAAAAEEASAGEGWIVGVRNSDYGAQVYLELAGDGGSGGVSDVRLEKEADRGLALLKLIASGYETPA